MPGKPAPAERIKEPVAAPESLRIVSTAGFADYALLDSGSGRKLERFGSIVLDRPEAQALWRPQLAKPEWSKAHAVFSATDEDEEKGRWRIDKPVPDSWPVKLDVAGQRATILCRLQGLWHLGLFPEQVPHWQWMIERLAAIKDEKPRVLNLFAYTGAASLLAARAGAEVTHVDASKKAIQWAKENQAGSGLSDAPLRWILDDARKFVAREVRRGRTYHVILVDPPKFGRGPEGEVWDLFQHLSPLLADCAKLLTPKSASMILTVYAIRASALTFDQLMREALKDHRGTFDTGELAIAEHSPARRLLPTSLFTRWAG